MFQLRLQSQNNSHWQNNSVRFCATNCRKLTNGWSRREEMKGLTWKQKQSVIKQWKVKKAAVNAAAGSVSASPTASMSAAASAPRLPLMVPLPPYSARHATAPTYLPQFSPPVPPTLTGPYVQPWQHQPPAMQMVTFGRPACPAYPRPDELLVDLSPPPGNSIYPQTRDY